MSQDSDPTPDMPTPDGQAVTPNYTGKPVHKVANGEAFKAIVIGNAGVGKTRMTYLFVNERLLTEETKETVGVEFFSKTVMFGMIDQVTR